MIDMAIFCVDCKAETPHFEDVATIGRSHLPWDDVDVPCLYCEVCGLRTLEMNDERF